MWCYSYPYRRYLGFHIWLQRHFFSHVLSSAFKEIVQQLIDNSTTFKDKTEFAQAKYIKKKKKKWVQTVLFHILSITQKMKLLTSPLPLCIQVREWHNSPETLHSTPCHDVPWQRTRKNMVCDLGKLIIYSPFCHFQTHELPYLHSLLF